MYNIAVSRADGTPTPFFKEFTLQKPLYLGSDPKCGIRVKDSMPEHVSLVQDEQRQVWLVITPGAVAFLNDVIAEGRVHLKHGDLTQAFAFLDLVLPFTLLDSTPTLDRLSQRFCFFREIQAWIQKRREKRGTPQLSQQSEETSQATAAAPASPPRITSPRKVAHPPRSSSPQKLSQQAQQTKPRAISPSLQSNTVNEPAPISSSQPSSVALSAASANGQRTPTKRRLDLGPSTPEPCSRVEVTGSRRRLRTDGLPSASPTTPTKTPKPPTTSTPKSHKEATPSRLTNSQEEKTIQKRLTFDDLLEAAKLEDSDEKAQADEKAKADANGSAEKTKTAEKPVTEKARKVSEEIVVPKRPGLRSSGKKPLEEAAVPTIVPKIPDIDTGNNVEDVKVEDVLNVLLSCVKILMHQYALTMDPDQTTPFNKIEKVGREWRIAPSKSGGIRHYLPYSSRIAESEVSSVDASKRGSQAKPETEPSADYSFPAFREIRPREAKGKLTHKLQPAPEKVKEEELPAKAEEPIRKRVRSKSVATDSERPTKRRKVEPSAKKKNSMSPPKKAAKKDKKKSKDANEDSSEESSNSDSASSSEKDSNDKEDLSPRRKAALPAQGSPPERKSHRWTDEEEEIIRTHIRSDTPKSELERVRVKLLGGDTNGITRQRFRFKVYDYLQRGVGWIRKSRQGGPSPPKKFNNIKKEKDDKEEALEAEEVSEQPRRRWLNESDDEKGSKDQSDEEDMKAKAKRKKSNLKRSRDFESEEEAPTKKARVEPVEPVLDEVLKALITKAPSPPARSEEDLGMIPDRTLIAEILTIWKGPRTSRELWAYFNRHYHDISERYLSNILEVAVKQQVYWKTGDGENARYINAPKLD